MANEAGETHDVTGVSRLATIQARQRELAARLAAAVADDLVEEIAFLEYELALLGGEARALVARTDRPN